MGKRVNQSGQAITEMVIGLLGMMAVFLGLLFFAAIGIENINGMLTARSIADENAVNKVSPGGGMSIVEWLAGNDNLAYTADDTANAGAGELSEDYTSQLTATYQNQTFTLNDPLTIGGYPVNTEFDDIPAGAIFLWAARLTEGQYSNADPLATYKLEDLKGAFRSLLGKDVDFKVEQKAYMSVATE